MAAWVVNPVWLIHEGGKALVVLGGIMSGWWGHSFRARSLARQEVLDAGKIALGMVKRAEVRESELIDLIQAYERELSELRRIRWDTMDCLATVQAQALGSRLIVRELDERLGLPRRQFDPLPSFPPELETGAKAGDTAEPREDTRTDNRPATPAGAGPV